MAPPINFCAAAENVAISTKSITELLGDKFKVLSYTIKFNDSGDENFAFGFSKASPMDCYDYENAEDVMTFLELDPDEPKSLYPPYNAGTLMYLSLWRNPKNINYVYISIKVKNYRSGTYAFSCNSHQDYLVVRCKPALVMGGFINFMNTEEYLEQLSVSNDRGICTICMVNEANIFYEECNHLCSCEGCAQNLSKHKKTCPICFKGKSLDVEKNRVNVKSLYCVNCLDKKCEDVNILNVPCHCLLSCISQDLEPCQYCGQMVTSSMKVYPQ